MSEINDELIQKARNADLADYFLRNGYDCEMKSKNELHVKGHGGLFVNRLGTVAAAVIRSTV